MATKRIRDNSGKFQYTFKSSFQRKRMKIMAAKGGTTVQELITTALEVTYPAMMTGR